MAGLYNSKAWSVATVESLGRDDPWSHRNSETQPKVPHIPAVLGTSQSLGWDTASSEYI